MATTTIQDYGTSIHTVRHEGPMAKMHAAHYQKFAVMVALSFIAMYILMYAMVNTFANVFNNVNQVYMAGLMAAPMAIIEIVLMRSMYPSKLANVIIIIASAALMAFFWSGIRNQIGVGDQQFVRSMIPHHSGAILMCREASLQDPELKNLCSEIIKGQQNEIDQMGSILNRLSK